VPECEILTPSHPVKAFIRNRDFFKIISVMETGAEQGMWTFDRYRNWLDRKSDWHIPERDPEKLDPEVAEVPGIPSLPSPPHKSLRRTSPSAKAEAPSPGGRIEIDPDESPFGRILRRPDE
jgi:twitching motility protein PilT